MLKNNFKNQLYFFKKSFENKKITGKKDNNSSAKYCQKNKKILQKKTHERYQNLSEEEKNKNMDANDIKISLKMTNKG